MKRFACSVMLVLLLIGVVSITANATEYKIIDLGILTSGDSCAYDVNNTSQVVGYYNLVPGIKYPFLWDSNGMQEFLAQPGSSIVSRECIARSINESGTIVGYSLPLSDGVHAFAWSNTGGLKDLGYGFAYGINTQGVVVGESNGDACYWDTSGIKHNMAPVNDFSSVSDINDAGQAVGFFDNLACFWQDVNHMQIIGSLNNATYSHACGINQSGTVVGYSCNYDYKVSSDAKVFIWDEVNLMQEIVIPEASAAYAFDINNQGLIVGSTLDSDGKHQAYVWDSVNGAQYLNTLNGGEAEARAINDNGWIVGVSSGHAVIWMPVPEPSSLIALVGGLAGVTGMLRRRS
jgi:probable HAF family extracellular repeat protein